MGMESFGPQQSSGHLGRERRRERSGIGQRTQRGGGLWLGSLLHGAARAEAPEQAQGRHGEAKGQQPHFQGKASL